MFANVQFFMFCTNIITSNLNIFWKYIYRIRGDYIIKQRIWNTCEKLSGNVHGYMSNLYFMMTYLRFLLAKFVDFIGLRII